MEWYGWVIDFKEQSFCPQRTRQNRLLNCTHLIIWFPASTIQSKKGHHDQIRLKNVLLPLIIIIFAILITFSQRRPPSCWRLLQWSGAKLISCCFIVVSLFVVCCLFLARLLFFCCCLFVAYFLFVVVVVACLLLLLVCCLCVCLLLVVFCVLFIVRWIYNHYGYSGLLVGHTSWGETSGRGVFTQLAHRACIQGMKW